MAIMNISEKKLGILGDQVKTLTHRSPTIIELVQERGALQKNCHVLKVYYNNLVYSKFEHNGMN